MQLHRDYRQTMQGQRRRCNKTLSIASTRGREKFFITGSNVYENHVIPYLYNLKKHRLASEYKLPSCSTSSIILHVFYLKRKLSV